MQKRVQIKRQQVIKALECKLAQLQEKNRQIAETKTAKYKQFVRSLVDLQQKNYPKLQSLLGNLILDYGNCLENNQSSKCNLRQLTNYLKNEQSLSMEVADYLLSLENQQINDYHDLINSNQYNKILSQLTLKRLEDQISYIESNVMSGNTFIYQPRIQKSSISVEDIKKELTQLERVIMLNPHCAVEIPKQIQLTIKKQYFRQKQLHEAISKQIKEISQQTARFKDIKPQNFVLKQERDKVQQRSKRRKGQIVQFVEFDIRSIQEIRFYENDHIEKMYQQIEHMQSSLTTQQLHK